ncbi:diguanylate cyclase [Nitrincola alkalilacustris]|uniref:sensor domain-containing diguanylate cyclase n=1 Tax=Nitrincola alkalilacustris TaxID=1571224 RepID=UPI00124E5F5C|nr:diguanylate cyclase [Nitrincola alkalilacustris]
MKLGEQNISIEEFHWQLGLLQTLDVGLIVLDHDFKIQLWNSFMVNHSGISDSKVRNKSLFDTFPELPATWLKRKLNSVFLLNNRAFITWEERPYLFRFKSYRPITGRADFMYQNITLIPLASPSGQVEHLGILIYDMTDAAVSRLDLQQANAELSQLSRTDRLTKLNNRGYWEECVKHEFERYVRTQIPSSLVMLDIDHFKPINDTLGHLAGDEVIRKLASEISHHARATDIAGRYGGEEFGILLVNTPAANAEIFAERLRSAVEGLDIRYDDKRIDITVSIGIAEVDNLQDDYHRWIEQTDQALYFSKEHGRNRVTVFSHISK